MLMSSLSTLKTLNNFGSCLFFGVFVLFWPQAGRILSKVVLVLVSLWFTSVCCVNKTA